MGYRQYHINPTDLVLEIGSGHDPMLRSDVLCDRYLEDNREREGIHNVKLDERPFVVADAQALPFKDKAFGYLICQHVLEHADDPERFISEMTRVSKRGYVETPSRFWETIYAAKEYHHWILDYRKGKLWIAPKREEDKSKFNGVFTELWREHPDFRAFHASSPELMYTYLEWDGKIDYVMLPEASTQFELEDYKDLIASSAERARNTQKTSPGQKAYHNARAFAGRLKQRARQQASAKKIDLDALLCCPANTCHGALKHESDMYRCEKCARIYPIINGIPRLLVDQA